jgi:hypothetical protein
VAILSLLSVAAAYQSHTQSFKQGNAPAVTTYIHKPAGALHATVHSQPSAQPSEVHQAYNEEKYLAGVHALVPSYANKNVHAPYHNAGPVYHAAAPIVHTAHIVHAPVQASAYHASAPSYHAQAPVHAPAYHAPAPASAYHGPAPLHSLPYHAPAPAFHALAPVHTPAYHAPAPASAYHGPAPVHALPYHAPAPAYHARAPVHAPAYHAPAPAPAYYAPAPVHAPAYHAPAPVLAPAYHSPTPHVGGYQEPEYSAAPVYHYNYGVHDDYSGACFQSNEDRDNYATHGEYRVALPDGRTQCNKVTLRHYGRQ